MTWQPSGDSNPAQHDGTPGALRVLALTAVGTGVAALAVATFVMSYKAIRAVTLQAGIQPHYARVYPLLLDAMLVIALAAVLALRGAGVPSRILSWLALLAVLGAEAGAGILHATGRRLPHEAAATTAAVLPWALVLVAFVLLLAMLRHARRHRPAVRPSRRQPPHAVTGGRSRADPAGPGQPRLAPAAPSLPVRTPQPWHSVSIVPGFTPQLASSAAAGAAAGAAAASEATDDQTEAPADDSPRPEGEAETGPTTPAAEPPGEGSSQEGAGPPAPPQG